MAQKFLTSNEVGELILKHFRDVKAQLVIVRKEHPEFSDEELARSAAHEISRRVFGE